jgi:NAD/NADP transhydrogenase beta subunit
MYSLVRAYGLRGVLMQQIPLIAASLIAMEGVIELVGELHSFIGEFAIFMGIWYLLDYGVNKLFIKK